MRFNILSNQITETIKTLSIFTTSENVCARICTRDFPKLLHVKNFVVGGMNVVTYFESTVQLMRIPQVSNRSVHLKKIKITI